MPNFNHVSVVFVLKTLSIVNVDFMYSMLSGLYSFVCLLENIFAGVECA